VLIKILTLNIAYLYYPKTDSNRVPYKNEQPMLFVADHLITTASDIALLQEVDKFTDRRGFLRDTGSIKHIGWPYIFVFCGTEK
jgi:hypothetical protein